MYFMRFYIKVFICLQNEAVSMLLANTAGLASPVLCTFSNGLCFQYVPGCQPDLSICQEKQFCRQMFDLFVQDEVNINS